MASDGPFLSTDVDEWLYAVLSVDPFMQSYAPGGFWSNRADQVVNGAWASSVSYGLGDSVEGSDGLFYRSLGSGNVGHDPVLGSGYWSACFPCVRWWEQSAGRDVLRQDGQMGRSESQPCFVVGMLDRQRGGVLDLVGGTNGHLRDGALRLVELLHPRNEVFMTGDGRSIQFSCNVISALQPLIDASNGDNEVLVGHWYQIRAQ